MAIEKAKKVEIIGFDKIKYQVLRKLQEEEIIHLETPSSEKLPSLEAPNLRDLERVVKFLSSFEKKKFMGDIFPEVRFKNREEFKALRPEDLSSMTEELLKISSQIEERALKIKERNDELRTISQLTFIDASLEEVHSLEHFLILFLRLNKMERSKLKELLSKKQFLLKELPSQNHRNIFVLLMHKHDLADAAGCLRKEGFNILDLALHVWANHPDKNPHEIIENLNSEIGELNTQIHSLKEKAKEYLSYKDKLMHLYDFMLNEEYKNSIEKDLLKTENFFLFDGWVLAEREKELLKSLEEFGDKIYVHTRQPQKGEIAPTYLKNNKVVAPFEILVKMYGPPHPRSLDPTRILAPFFFLFVGICISDAGYGIMLALISYYILWRKKLTETGKRFFTFLSYLGIATFLVGAALGGWWGRPAPFKIVDVMASPFQFLLFCFVLGFIQVITGIVMRIYIELKNRNYQKAISQLSWIGLLISLPLYFVYKISVFKAFSFVAVGGILLFSSQSKNIFARIGIGLYELYGITKYFSDVLSYSRLLALGMATGVIAMVINLLAGLAFKIPVLGIVFALGILIGGHLFNLAINLMTGFIHSARLQFVEFFSKFFDLGKKYFEPLKVKTKYNHVV